MFETFAAFNLLFLIIAIFLIILWIILPFNVNGILLQQKKINENLEHIRMELISLKSQNNQDKSE